MVTTSDETEIQILFHCPMSHAKLVTMDNRKNPEYIVVCRDKENMDTVPQKNHGKNHDGQTMLKLILREKRFETST